MKLFEETRAATVEDVSWLRQALKRELKSLRIETDLANDLLLAVAEMATNAVVHATSPPKSIGLKVDLIGASLRIEISDDGAPFADFADKWDECSRKDVAASGFSGLGLALANSLLHQVSYEPGGGGQPNRFIGWRPIQRVRPTVLLLDDDTTLLRLYRSLLKSRYRVLTATSVEMAHNLATSQPVDLILSDYHLGGDVGTRLVTVLEEDADRLPIPVIVLSRDPTVKNRETEHGFGIEMFLSKPVSPKVLTEAIEQVLARTRKRLTGLFRYFGANVERLSAAPSDAELGQLGVAYRSAMATAGGGDFMLSLTTASGANRFIVVDVMGHGLKAKAGAIALAAVLRSVNGMLPGDAGPGAFLSMLSRISNRDRALSDVVATLAVIDRNGDGVFVVSGAGHPAPFVAGAGGIRTIAAGGPLIGLFPTSEYSEEPVHLSAGERLVVVTDGVEPRYLASGAELPNAFVARLVETLDVSVSAAADAAAKWIADRHGPSPHDDWTIMLLEPAALGA